MSWETTFELFMVEIRLADWLGSSRWYVEVLGLKPILEDADRRFLLLEAGPGRIALKESPEPGDRGAVRLIFQVGNVDAVRAELIAKGVAVSEPTQSDEGYREVRLADPEGTPIHLFSWASVAKGESAGVFSVP
jgi:predicted enzyme related to lactoylglutathione lyase